MTHEELLNKLDDWAVYDCFYAQIMNALRAVVELHKASKVEGRWGKIRLCCLRCQTNYPCSTIQAIEKALS